MQSPDVAAGGRGVARHLVAVAAALHPGYLPREGEDWRRWAEMGADHSPEARVHHFSHILLALEAANWDQGMALINDYMLQPEDPRLVRLPLHALETGDNFYFVFKRSRAHEPAISRLRQWLWQESQASLRPGKTSLSGASERAGALCRMDGTAHDAGVWEA